MKSLSNCNSFKLLIGFLLLFSGCKINNKVAVKSATFKVMSYNIHHGNPPDGTDRIDLDAIAKAIKAAKPDIVALQEVDVNTKRSGNINEAKLLADKLNMFVFFSKAIDYDGGDYGLAILSKYPLSETSFQKLSSAADSTAEPRIFQTVHIKISNQKEIIFGNTHLDVLNTGNRALQASQITEVVKNSSLPFILAGDWNATIGSKTLKIMDSALIRTCDNCPVTCPEEGSKGAIDFIAFSRQNPFIVKNYKVFNNNFSSDHFPILAELQLN